jgi:hypothetical protein
VFLRGLSDAQFTVTGIFGGKLKSIGVYRSADELGVVLTEYRDKGFYIASSTQTVGGAIKTLGKVVATTPLIALGAAGAFSIVGVAAAGMFVAGIEVPAWMLQPFNSMVRPGDDLTFLDGTKKIFTGFNKSGSSMHYTHTLISNALPVDFSKLSASELTRLDVYGSKIDYTQVDPGKIAQLLANGRNIPTDVIVDKLISPSTDFVDIVDIVKAVSTKQLITEILPNPNLPDGVKQEIMRYTNPLNVSDAVSGLREKSGAVLEKLTKDSVQLGRDLAKMYGIPSK